MALAVAQAGLKVESASVNSVTVNSAWTVAAGSLLIGHIVSAGTETSHSCSGSVNGTFTQVGLISNGSNPSVSDNYKANSTSGAEDLTATVAGSASQGVTAVFHEVTGADTSAPFTTGEHAQAAYTATTNPQTANVNNSVADSIFFAAAGNFDSANPATYTVNSTGSSPTGWALKNSTNSQELNAASFWTISAPFLIVTSSANTKHGWTTNNFLGSYVIACWKVAGGQDTPELRGRPEGLRGQRQMAQLLAQ